MADNEKANPSESPSALDKAAREKWEDAKKAFQHRQSIQHEDDGIKQKTLDGEKLWEERYKRILKRHVLTGASLFSGFQLLLGLTPFNDFIAAIVSAVIMFPVGAFASYIISKRHLGHLLGGAVGILVVFALLFIIVTIWGRSLPDTFGIFILLAASTISGGIPGALAGAHIQMDR